MDIMEALANVSQADLEKIDTRLAEIEAEIQATTAPLNIEKRKLMNARGVILKLVGGETKGLSDRLVELVTSRGTVDKDTAIHVLKVSPATLRGASNGAVKRGVIYCKKTKTFSIIQTDKAKPADKSAVMDTGEKMTLEKCRELVFDLLTENGSLPVSVISARLRIPSLFIGRAINHEWFVKDPSGDINIAR